MERRTWKSMAALGAAQNDLQKLQRFILLVPHIPKSMNISTLFSCSEVFGYKSITIHISNKFSLLINQPNN
jgi:hypothetical protein